MTGDRADAGAQTAPPKTESPQPGGPVAPRRPASRPASRPRPVAAALTIVLAAVVALGLPLSAPTLNAVSVAGLPLGYYMSAQGGLICVALLGLWLSGPWNAADPGTRPAAFAAAISATGTWLTTGTALTLIGALFVFGYDGLPLYLGLAAGLLVSLVFFAPALDRNGALHVDDLLGRLTGSRAAAFASGLAMTAGLTLLVSIELEVASLAAGVLAGPMPAVVPFEFGPRDVDLNVFVVAALAFAASLVPGRRLWTAVSAMSFIVIGVLVGILAAALAGFAADRLVPQLAYGPALAEVTSLERRLLLERLADPVVMPPFLRPFVQLSLENFLVLTVSAMLGAAVLPHALWRRRIAAEGSAAASGDAAGTAAPGVRHGFASRHKAAFGLVLAALVLSALPAVSIPIKVAIYGAVADGVSMADPPGWLESGRDAGFMRVCAGDASPCATGEGRVGVGDLAINPAGALLLAPQLAGLPATAGTMASGLILLLAVLAAAATLRMANEAALGWSRPRAARLASGSTVADNHLTLALRLPATLAVAVAAVALVAILGESPVNRLYWALAVVGAGVFPMLLVAALLPRAGGLPLAAGGLVGFAVALYYVIGTTGPWAAHFALLWADVSDAPPWLLEELTQLLAHCANGGQDAAAACAAAVEEGRSLANWFGIDPRGAAVLGAPAGLAVALLLAVLDPGFWRATRAP